MRLPLCLLLALFISALSATAQRTWVVDIWNGPGADFTALPPAVQAASAGDTIVVRAGVYDGVAIDRGITLIGLGSPIIGSRPVGPGGDQRAIYVHGIAGGRTFLMHGFNLSAASSPTSITVEIRGCAGRVVLSDVSLGPAGNPAESLRVVSCADVTLSDCYCNGGMRGEDSVLSVRDTIVYGTSARQNFGTLVNAAYPALHATRCDLSVCAGIFRGGHGIEGRTPDASAMVLEQSSTRMSTGWRIQLATGSFTAAAEFVLVANGGSLALDASIPLSIAGSAVVERRTVASMHSVPAAVGSVLPFELYAEPSSTYQIFLGIMGDPIALPPIGTLWIEPAALFPFATGRLDLTGSTVRGFVLPNDPGLQGFTLRAQALVLSGGGLVLSDPAVAVIY